MLNLNSIMIFSENPERLRDFYEKVLDKKPDMSEGGYYGFMVGQTYLSFGPHDKVKGKNQYPERIMFNFETEDVPAEFERLKGLGAEVVAEPYQMGEMPGWIATFADPDGNFFQLMSPWEAEG